LDLDALEAELGIPASDLHPDLPSISVPFQMRRRGVEARLVIGDQHPAADPVLVRALAEAHRFAAALRAGVPLHLIARDAGYHLSQIRFRTQLAFLSPRIQLAIRDGTQPTDLTLNRIVRKPVPQDRNEQERLYGF